MVLISFLSTTQEQKEEVTVKSYKIMVMRHTWYVFETMLGLYGNLECPHISHYVYIQYAPIGVLHMVYMVILDVITSDTFNWEYQ